MVARRRLIAGMVALLAMTFSYAESVWAATCAPMSAMEAATATVGGTMPAAESPGHPPMGGEDAEGPGEQRHCPFSAVAAQGCATAASLPANPIASPATPSGDAPVIAAYARLRSILFDAALFRPPRS